MVGNNHEIAVAQVLAQVPDSHAVQVIFQSGQPLGTLAYVMSNGAADAYRFDQNELPTPGTWGIVIMPNGDDRNAVWIGSINVAAIDAINSSGPGSDPYMRYLAHYSGFYRILDQDGNFFARFPDGTSVQVGDSTTEPVTYRHTLGGSDGQQRISVVYPDSDRVTPVPSPFNAQLKHPSGTQVTIGPSGNVSLLVASGASFQFSDPSGFGITKDGAGNIVINGNTVTIQTPAGNSILLDKSGNIVINGSTVTIQTPAGNSVLLDKSGNITETAPIINLDGNVDVSGNISGGTGSSGGIAIFNGNISTTGGMTSSSDVVAGGISVINHYHTYNPGSGSPTNTSPAEG